MILTLDFTCQGFFDQRQDAISRNYGICFVSGLYSHTQASSSVIIEGKNVWIVPGSHSHSCHVMSGYGEQVLLTPVSFAKLSQNFMTGTNSYFNILCTSLLVNYSACEAGFLMIMIL